MTTTSDILPRAAAPCPSWCGMPVGHPFHGEASDREGVQREHALTVGKWQSPFTERVRSWYAVLEITALGEAGSDDSPTERIIRQPLVYVEGDADDLTAEQARDLAAFLSVALRSAAQQLDAIQT